jgi:tRNA modification GTPase
MEKISLPINQTSQNLSQRNLGVRNLCCIFATMNQQDTIIALATPSGMGAIAVIRISGDQSIQSVDKVFRSIHQKKLSDQKSHTVHLGHLYQESRVLDQVLVTVFKNPHSYTGEDVVEISCHGSVYVQQQILQLFVSNGVRLADAGEFTLRAFLNGKMDLSQAEAVADLIASENQGAHQIAMQQMRGGFSNHLKNLREELLHFASMIELELDFSEEDVAFADMDTFYELVLKIKGILQNLLDSFSTGNVLKNGVPVAIAGKPNAGKSSLLNALLNENKAIVSDIAGTTRDSIEDTLIIDGIAYRFIDTAGLRETSNTIEAIGVERAKDHISNARILLYLYDQLDTTPEEILADLATFQRKELTIILVQNKCDLLGGYFENDFTKKLNALGRNRYSSTIIAISTMDTKSLGALKSVLSEELNSKPSAGNTIVSNSRHFELLNHALKSIVLVQEGLEAKISGDLLAIDLRETIHHLGEITGEITTDDLLGNIFSSFCIGK